MKDKARLQDSSCRLNEHSVGIVVSKLGDADHGVEHLGEEEESTGQDDENEDSRDGILEQLHNGLEDGVDCPRTDCEGVESISSHIFPELLHQRPLWPKRHGSLLA